MSVYDGGAVGAPVVPGEVETALKNLKGADASARHKIYDLIADKGDALDIPALKAFRDGSLQIVNGRLALYGPRVTLKEQGSVLPLQDALTGQPITGDDGKPVYHPKPDLSNALRAPPRSEREIINAVISGLSLLDLDPVARLQSIRDVGERAAQAFVDQDTQKRFAQECLAGASALRADTSTPSASGLVADAISALQAAAADKPKDLVSPAPGGPAVLKVKIALAKLQSALKPADAAVPAAPPVGMAKIVADLLLSAGRYQDALDAQQKVLDDLPKSAAALKRQFAKDPSSHFAPALKESIAECDLVFGDPATRLNAARILGRLDTAALPTSCRK